MTQYNSSLSEYFTLETAPWAIVQYDKNQNIKNTWASFDSSNKIEFVEGEDALHLKKKIESQNGNIITIPEYYLCIPTGMDLQTHLRYPGQHEKETLSSGILSAIQGGYDTIVSMPNTYPFLDNPNILSTTIKEASMQSSEITLHGKVNLELLFTASASIKMKGKRITDIKELKKYGAVAITDDGWGVEDDDLMVEILSLCQEHQIPFFQHAEIPGHRGVASSSSFQSANNLTPYPRTAESEMVKRDLKLLVKFPNVRYHVLHISTKETVDLIYQAKKDGLPVTAEVTPHHLMFCNEDITPVNETNSTSFKMNPPLFSKEDKDCLRESLSNGTIDCISTDHAPHSIVDKKLPWDRAPFGTRGLVTALPCLITLLKEGVFNYQRVIEVFSQFPRHFLRNNCKYKTPSGYIFVDPQDYFTVKSQYLAGKSRNSCFIDKKLTGKIILRAEKGCLLRA